MPANDPHDQLFQALQGAGISRSHIRKMLPDWWTDELLDDQAARLELDINLSRMFGLKLSNLLQDRPTITFDLPGGAKYKRSKKIGAGELSKATSIIHSISKMVVACMETPVIPLPSDPLEVRRETLTMHPKRVSLMAMVDYLWSHGIPTIHVLEMPDGLKKMDGLVLRIGNRPVVILCKRSTYEAWHLFIVAHELAHCALGHVEGDEVLVDCTLGEDSYLLGEADPEEVAADNFSIAILNGEPGVSYTSNYLPNANQLANSAIVYQRWHQVDAGHIILNYGHYNNAWAIAQAALRHIDQGDAPRRINQFLFDHLNLALLPESSADYLLKVTGMNANERCEDQSE